MPPPSTRGRRVVEHDALAGRDPPLRLVPRDVDASRVGDDDRRPPCGRAVGAALHEHRRRRPARRPRSTSRRRRSTGRSRSARRRPRPSTRRDVDVDDVALRAAAGQAEAPALPDVTISTASTSPDRRAGGVDDARRVERDPVAEELARGRRSDVMKHTSWLSGLAAVRSPSSAASRRTSALSMSPTGNSVRASAGLVEHVHDVALVLGPVGAALERAAPVAVAPDAGVVAGGDGVEAERSARSASRSNFTWRLHSMHGFGVDAAGVGGDVRVDHVARRSRRVKLNTRWSMSSCWATRRASSTSVTLQHPVSLSPPHSLIVTPTTSWPSRAAARRRPTSRPRRSSPPSPSSACTGSRRPCDRASVVTAPVSASIARVDVGVGGRVAERQPQRARPPATGRRPSPPARATAPSPRWRTPTPPTRTRRPRRAGTAAPRSRRRRCTRGPSRPPCGRGARSRRDAVELRRRARRRAGRGARRCGRLGRRARRRSRPAPRPWRRCRPRCACRCGARAPGRRRRSAGRAPTPSRTTSTPTPFGPPNLWALSDIRSTCGEISRRSSQHGRLHGVGVQQRPRRAAADDARPRRRGR